LYYSKVLINMADDIQHCQSIASLHQGMGLPKPKHPLVSIIREADFHMPKELIGQRTSANLYMIALKGSQCGIQYGRKHYDFEEGVLVFSAPNQVYTVTQEPDGKDDKGWLLFFHPDFIRKSSLGQSIDGYTFFSYQQHESLHLHAQEQKTLTDCVQKIEDEYNQRIDNHSQRVMISGLELLLNYCARFYERQFNTRSVQHKDIVGQVEQLLKDYLASEQLVEHGPPSIQYMADRVHLSPNYLSDLLKKETGRTTKDHINHFLVEKAKGRLVNSNDTVSEIAYALGFNYPHYFSRLFKAKTGVTPQQYRELN